MSVVVLLKLCAPMPVDVTCTFCSDTGCLRHTVTARHWVAWQTTSSTTFCTVQRKIMNKPGSCFIGSWRGTCTKLWHTRTSRPNCWMRRFTWLFITKHEFRTREVSSTIAQGVRLWLLTPETLVHYRVTAWEIYSDIFKERIEVHIVKQLQQLKLEQQLVQSNFHCGIILKKVCNLNFADNIWVTQLDCISWYILSLCLINIVSSRLVCLVLLYYEILVPVSITRAQHKMCRMKTWRHWFVFTITGH